MSSVSSPPSTQMPRYQIPTHLDVPDKIAIPLFGITFSVTMRQGLIFFFGVSAAVACWRDTTSWQALSLIGLLGHWGLPGIMAVITFGLALLVIQGRTLEQWGMVLLRYAVMPRLLVWQSVADEHLLIAQREQDREAAEHDDKEHTGGSYAQEASA